jgi:hypothetical protein
MKGDTMPNPRDKNLQDKSEKKADREGSGKMTVQEAGHKGGQRVKELIEKGEESEEEGR